MNYIRRLCRVFFTEGWMGIAQRFRRKLAGWIDPSLVTIPSSPEPHAVASELDTIAAEMRHILATSTSSLPDGEAVRLLKYYAPWYHRLELPNGLTTTSDPNWAVYDGAPDNLLGGRLAAQQAALLRPLPKWAFIRSRLPELTGRTILEVGSNCGFFSFQFAKLGAIQVTGVEAIEEYVLQAKAIQSWLGVSNIHFIKMDWCHDDPIEPHDIVFSSEAVGHFQFPFLGLYRLLAASRKHLVLDLGVHWATRPTAYFGLMRGHTRYHAFSMSDSLLTGYLVRCGIPSECVTKHPYGNKRCLYIVDVSSADLRTRFMSADDPLWSGKFTFDPERGASYRDA